MLKVRKSQNCVSELSDSVTSMLMKRMPFRIQDSLIFQTKILNSKVS